MKSFQKTGQKVVLGFFITTIFLVAVVGLTYVTLKRLENSVYELAQPSQKLELLNAIQADVFTIISTGSDSIGSDVRVKDSKILSFEKLLTQLDSLAGKSSEKAKIQSIRENLALLIVGYLDLHDVKSSIDSRTFSKEALRKVEIGIRRRSEALNLAPLQKLDPKRFNIENSANVAVEPKSDKPGIVIQDKDRINQIIQGLQTQSQRTGAIESKSLDSVLFSVKSVIQNIYREESTQRSRLAEIERQIFQNQQEIGISIQNLVSNLQAETIRTSRIQSLKTELLVQDVNFFMFIFLILTVLGALAMVYSILREIRLNAVYQDNLEESRVKSELLARSKQEFLANMSHEIRNPLHVIQGFRTVLEKSDLNTEQRSQLSQIAFASDTLLEIVNDILDFSKLESGKLKLENRPFDPFHLFGSVGDFFELPAREKKLLLKWELDLPENFWFMGDELRFKQILNNLLSNAIKFTPEGGVDVHVSWQSGNLKIQVTDTGIGMDEEELSKVFEEFNQADASTSRKYGGTGLGLVIVQRLITLMEGEIQIKSKKGEGTEITLTVPVETCAPQEVPLLEIEGNSVDLSGLNILLVDDDSVGIKYLETLLSYYGATTHSFVGGVDFRDNFQKGSYDMAFIDIQMPEFNGFEVIGKIRGIEDLANLPVVAMTANVFIEEKEKMFEAGFTDLILKPFVENQLLALIGKFFPERVHLVQTEKEKMVQNEEQFYDLADLEKFCMGDRDLLDDILRDLVVQTTQDLERLIQARLNNRWDEILEICHQLSSRLGQIKSPAGKKAAHIENVLKLNVRKGLQKNLVELDEEVRKTLKGLSEKINEKV